MRFVDTSIVIAFYLPEAYSQQVQALYATQPVPIISNLVEVEVVSVFSRLVRTQSLTLEEAQQAAVLFSSHVEQGFYRRLSLHTGHYRTARDYIARFDLPLKAPDALHLAAAALEQLSLVTADRQLARNAERLGITVELLSAAS
jgi:uncharacterized protein